VCVVEPTVLLLGAERRLRDLDVDIRGVGHFKCRLVELSGVLTHDIHVVRLVVNLCGVDPRGHHKRRIHFRAALVGQELFREVEQTVQKEHHTVLVAVALALNRVVDHQRVCISDSEAVRVISVRFDVCRLRDRVGENVVHRGIETV